MVDKGEVLISVYKELKEAADADAERFKLLMHESEGARAKLIDAHKQVTGFTAQVRKDLNDGKLHPAPMPEDFEGTYEDYIAQHIFVILHRALDRCGYVLQNIGDTALSAKLVASGERNSSLRNARIFETKIKEETAKLEAKAAPTAARVRPVGVRPVSKRKKKAMEKAGFSDEEAYDAWLLEQKEAEADKEQEAPAEESN